MNGDFDQEKSRRGQIKLAKPIQNSQCEADVTIVHLSHSQNNIILYLTSILREKLVGTDFVLYTLP